MLILVLVLVLASLVLVLVLVLVGLVLVLVLACPVLVNITAWTQLHVNSLAVAVCHVHHELRDLVNVGLSTV